MALAVVLAVGVEYRRPRHVTVDLLLMFAVSACFFEVMRFFDHFGSRAYVNLLDWVFVAVFALTFTLLIRCLLRVVRDASTAWRPNLGPTVLAALAAGLLLLDIAAVLMRAPDDAGFFVNLGAQRLRERGQFPYGDPLLTGTPGAAYAPLLYAAHVPFQLALAPGGVNAASPDLPRLGAESTYFLPPQLATQLCALAFHLAGVLGLFVAARRLAGLHVALGIVCLYSGSLAILGIGGHDYPVAGITFVSHIAPASVALLAFAALPWPAVAGVLLVAAAGTGFYPAFMGPAWLGYYWTDRRARMRFVVACTVTSLVLIAIVYMWSQPAPGLSTIGTFIRDSFGHHTDPAGYGSSPFGFWGQKDAIRQFAVTPLLTSTFTTPAWLAFFALIAASALLARGRPAASLASLSAAVAMAATLVKPHATGTYMAWYFGFLLIGVCAARGARGNAGQTEPDFERRDEFGNNEANLRFLRDTLPPDSEQSVLEIGSGRGALIRQLLQEGHRIEGVEINQDQIDESRRLFGTLPIAKVDGPLLPFPDASFDVVLSFDVFEHIRDSDEHLREVQRVLKPRGRYLLQTPNKWTNTVFETIRWRSFSSWRHDHCALHSYRQLQHRFERNGFDLRFVDIPVVTPFFRRKLRHYLGAIAPFLLAVVNPDRLPLPLRTNFYVVAQKRDTAG